MPDVHRGTQPVGLIAWHLSVGMLSLLLVALRIVWRFTHPAPPELPNIPHTLAAVARFTHWALYLLLIALPLMGWADASSRGWPTFMGTLLPLPSLTPEGSPFGHSLGDWHSVFAWFCSRLLDCMRPLRFFIILSFEMPPFGACFPNRVIAHSKPLSA
jgi:cytochrome b561